MYIDEYLQDIEDGIDDIGIGKVIKNKDPENKRRVKVRVNGVFNEPISKAHIPYAMPLIPDGRVPDLGEYAIVFFIQKDLYRLLYIPTNHLGGDRLEYLKNVYSKVLDKKNEISTKTINRVNGSVDVNLLNDDNSFNYNKKVYIRAEDVAEETNEGYDLKNPETGFLSVRNYEKGNEYQSDVHPSGSFFDVDKEGNSVYRVTGDFKAIIEKLFALSAKDSATIEVNGNIIDIDKGGKIYIRGNTSNAQFLVDSDGKLNLSNSYANNRDILYDLVNQLVISQIITPVGPGVFSPQDITKFNEIITRIDLLFK